MNFIDHNKNKKCFHCWIYAFLCCVIIFNICVKQQYWFLSFLIPIGWFVTKSSHRIRTIIFLTMTSGIYFCLVVFGQDYNFFYFLQQNDFFIKGKTIRMHFLSLIQKKYPQEIVQYIELILFNIQNEVTKKFYQQATQLSIAYLICVSGFHFGILKKMIDLVFRKYEHVAFGINFLILTFYTYLLNYSYPALRTVIMLVLGQKKIMEKFSIDEFDRFGLCGLIVLFFCPAAVKSYSFKLSYLGTLIVILVRNWNLNTFIEKIVLNILITIVSLPFVISMSHKITIFVVFNCLIFNYVFVFIYLYFLLFSWFWFLTPLHLFVLRSLVVLITNYNNFDVIIKFGWWTNFQKATYFFIVYYFCQIINHFLVRRS